MNPLVSILTTVYNRKNYIEECINSVLELNYTKWELIIVDDCSKDNSAEIIQQYAKKDERIRFYQNETNIGDYPNRNKAASFAKGKYLKYLDADDTIYKYTLDYMVEAMEKYQNAALGLSYNTIDDKTPFPQISLPQASIYAEFLSKSIIGCGPSASIIRKDIFEEFGGFSGKQYIGDHELWFKIAKKYAIVKLQPSLIWWRVHEGQQIVDERKNTNIQNIRYHIQNEYLQSCRDFFSPDEFILAEKKIKQNYARNLLRTLLIHHQYSSFLKLYKTSKLSFSQLIKGFKGYL